MTVRLCSPRAASFHGGVCRIATAAAIAFVTAGAGNAYAAAAGAASAPAVASGADAAGLAGSASAVAATAGMASAGGQFLVHPGQSLNDVAIAVTQSHDRATLARASRALFDANPSAFMGHDPSRLKLGATLTVPALDASGALAASAAAPASGAAQANAASSAAGAAPAKANAVSTPGQTNSQASVEAAGVARAASSPVSALASSAAPVAATSVATAAASAPSASQASTEHVWSGAVQPAASAPLEGASASVASGFASAQPPVQAHTQVSSLQQLLTLKNRVLMELQKHGIGGAPAQPSKASSEAVATSSETPSTTSGMAPAASMPGNGGAADLPAAGAESPSVSQENLGAAAAIGAALVALLAGLGLRRRRRAASAAQAAAPAVQREAVTPPEVIVPRDAASAQAVAEAYRAPVENREETDQRDAGEREATAQRDVAQREAVQPTHPETLDGATAAAGLAAAAELGAEALPPSRLDPSSDAFPPHEQSGHGQWRPDPESEPEPASAAPPDESHMSSAPQTDFTAPHAELHAMSAFGQPHSDAWVHTSPQQSPAGAFDQAERESPGEPAAAGPAPLEEPSLSLPATDQAAVSPAPMSAEPLPQAAPAAPSAFPRDAIDAFGSLDMPLPPRTESTVAAAAPPAPPAPLDMPPSGTPAPLDVLPPGKPATIAPQAVEPFEDDSASHVADENGADLAGSAALAGLGVARFGALNLDFDLELPPSPAQPLPAFTSQDLARIARNKLELASEYIELGDLAGARLLIHEVLEANEAGTRNEARALLSTLAPLS